jgi:hypothetical protein
MHRGMPYVICDTDGRPVDPDEAKAIIAEHWTVPADVRARRRSKKAGKAPQTVRAGQRLRGDLSRPETIDQHDTHRQHQPQRRTA